MRKVPDFKTDAEAEAFIEQDLSDLDFSQFRPLRFEPVPSAQINMRVPRELLEAVKPRAKSRGIPYSRYIRELMERDLTA